MTAARTAGRAALDSIVTKIREVELNLKQAVAQLIALVGSIDEGGVRIVVRVVEVDSLARFAHVAIFPANWRDYFVT